MPLCPVLQGFLCSISQHVDFKSPVGELFADQFNDLLVAVEQDALHVSRQRQHLRGFLCLELMGWLIKQHFNYDEHWERSRAGLGEVIVRARAISRNSIADEMEFLLRRPAPSTSVAPLRVANTKKAASVANYMIKAAVVLRRALGNPATLLYRTGFYLGEALECSGRDFSIRFSMCRHLLEQTEEHAPRAWEIALWRQ